MTSLAEILGSEKVTELSNTKFESTDYIKNKRDKYKPYKEILKDNEKLGNHIIRVFKDSKLIPSIHITSSAVRTKNEQVSTGFVDNIKENGFRDKDTNVGVFMKRDGTRHPAEPIDFVNNPEKFLRELETLIKNYLHHGTRTNKAQLGDLRGVSTGVPVMLLIDTTDINLERGSDYDNHYKLLESVAGSKIVGEIDLEGISTQLRERLPDIATKFLELTEAYTKKSY